MKLFLDDVRNPSECLLYMRKRIGEKYLIYNESWGVVRNYEEFVAAVEMNYKEITHISFDHDLADVNYDPKTWTETFIYREKTGYDCAKWLKEFYDNNGLTLPQMFVHSMNPVGTEMIINLFR